MNTATWQHLNAAAGNAATALSMATGIPAPNAQHNNMADFDGAPDHPTG